MIVATAGHIDHGKTSLVKALTGMDTDRLPQEVARGISIDLGYAYWTPPGHSPIAFVDVPGHEDFIRNMVAGVFAIDYAMLAVAADDGIMPQTIEHLRILELLGISNGMVVITKADRVPEKRLVEVQESVRIAIAAGPLRDIGITAVSMTKGTGISRLQDSIASAAGHLKQQTSFMRNFRMVIDRIFTISGSGTVVTGTVLGGSVRTGDTVLVQPGDVPARVRTIQRHGGIVGTATVGQRCALNLAGVKAGQLKRGHWATDPSIRGSTSRIDARIRLLAENANALKQGAEVHVHIGAAHVVARVGTPGGKALEPGATSFVQLTLKAPIFALHGDKLVVRDSSARRTLGGGMVVDPFPSNASRWASRRPLLDALSFEDAAQAFNGLLLASEEGIDLDKFRTMFNLTSLALEEIISKCHAAVIPGSRRAFSQGYVRGLRSAIDEALARRHVELPHEVGMEVDELRQCIAPMLHAASFRLLLDYFLKDSRLLKLTGTKLHHPLHTAAPTAADEKVWQNIRDVIKKRGHNVPKVPVLAVETRIDQARLRNLLQRRIATGEVIRVGEDRFYLTEVVTDLARIAETLALSSPAGRFAANQFRDASGLGRMLAIDILESLDSMGITRRIGNSRYCTSQRISGVNSV